MAASIWSCITFLTTQSASGPLPAKLALITSNDACDGNGGSFPALFLSPGRPSRIELLPAAKPAENSLALPAAKPEEADALPAAKPAKADDPVSLRLRTPNPSSE